jgi:hypothetical protein
VQDQSGEAKHPGKLDNSDLLKRMQSQAAVDEWQRRFKSNNPNTPHYYNISKHLFYFFLQLYGGGPVVMRQEDFLKYE